MSNTLIIPDIHGRNFWKTAVASHSPGEKIIFLGDYLDPYPQEGISKNDAVENFEELIDFIRLNKDDIEAMIGNHDCTYVFSHDLCYCRTDDKNYEKIRELFLNNIDLFKMCHYEEINGNKVLFSHAGVHKEYVNRVFGEIINDPKEVAERFNREILENKNPEIINMLAIVSYLRGGWGGTGSIVWADVREFDLTRPEYDNTLQIFAHTGSLGPIVQSYGMMLDAQRAFILNDKCIITELNGDEVVSKNIFDFEY